ncbi:MAG TPA: hypothetical protein VNQ81_12635 [Povalibacter sp.]|nr:hypothetical protein [Povalibacter sp.]
MNRLVTILAIAAVSCAGASAYFWKQVHHERNRAEQLQARVAELERYRSQPINPFTAVVGNPTATAEQPVADTPPALVAAAQPAAAAKTQIASNLKDVRERFRRQQRLLMDDPEYREALRVQHRMMLGQAYPGLAEALGIAPDQMDRFLDLLTEQQMTSRRVGPVDGNDPAQAEQWQSRFQERERSNQAAIADLLGVDGLQRWKDYQASLGARYRAKQLSNALESSGAPLRQDQVQPLQQALAAGNERARGQWQAVATRFQANGRRPSPEDQIELQEEQLQHMTQNNEQLRTALSAILSNQQMEALRQIQERELQVQQAQLRIQRAQLQAQERSGLAAEGADAFYLTAPAANLVIPD